MAHSRIYQGWLLAAFVLLFCLSMAGSPYPLHIFVHQVSCAIAIAGLAMMIVWCPLSNVAFTLVIAFLLLHILGARYIYTFVPYDDWARMVFGVSISDTFGWTRNNYDRMVHFSFGLLLVTPLQDIFGRAFQMRRDWALVLAVQTIVALSAIFELGEWQAAVILAPKWADSYLGQQGDLWDAQKDMALALLGAFVNVLITATVWRCFSRR